MICPYTSLRLLIIGQKCDLEENTGSGFLSIVFVVHKLCKVIRKKTAETLVFLTFVLTQGAREKALCLNYVSLK